MKVLTLLLVVLAFCVSAHAKSPSGVYELIQENASFRRIERWDFREDGTVTYFSRLEAYERDGLKSAPIHNRYFWKASWFGKEIYLKASKDTEGDGVVAFIQDGQDLIGTGKYTEYSERYLKKGN